MKSIYRKVIIYVCWGISFSFFFSCAEPQHSNGNIQVIDINASNNIKLAELFSDCKVIPLETTDSSLIGLAIDRMERYKGRIYILNQLQSHKNMICFDSSGNFLFNIDRIGRAPDEYTFLGDFFIDLNKKQLVLVSEAGRYVFFDLDGKYLYSKKTNISYLPRQVVFCDSNYLVYNDIGEQEKNCDLLLLDTATMDISRKLENLGEKTYNTGGRALSSFRGHVLYYHFNDTIYEVSMCGERKPSYYVNGGKAYADSKELIERKKKTLSGDDFVKFIYSQLSSGQLKYISSILENDRWMIINGKEKSKEQTFKSFFVLFDKNSQKSYNSSNIDFEFLDIENTDLQIICCSNNVLFCLVNTAFSPIGIERMERVNV